MKVILRTNLEKLGKAGDVVSVKDGYAVNYLIPKQYAYLATKGNLKAFEEEKKNINKRVQKEVSAAQKIKEEIEKVQITIPVSVGEEEKLFGSVTSQMIADGLKEKGFEIDKRKIEIEEAIKSLGIHDVPVRLHSSVHAVIKVWVVRE
ncbi:MAG: 50S ribosomal protein L9 [Ignavibacteriaceae bacterium]|nr:50S ribosomal protein L9 [Ignavibacteriaceae bacterium]